MNNEERYEYAYRLTSVASTGLSFVEDSLLKMMKDTTDMAWLRSFYILLSYNFELILKSRIVMTKNFLSKKEMNDELRRLGHDMVKIASSLGKSNSEDLGVREITEINNQYKIVTTDDKEIYIENFIKIRYDFLDDVMRIVDNKEHERISEYERGLSAILRKAKSKNKSDKNTQDGPV